MTSGHRNSYSETDAQSLRHANIIASLAQAINSRPIVLKLQLTVLMMSL